MKNYVVTLFALLGFMTALGQEKDNPEFVGENFSLEGALSMFKKANSIEEFESLINDEKNDVNNLDLNNDETIDYVTVEDIVEGDKHVLVLSALVGDNEKQDVATIVIEKTGNEEAQLQIFGDEDLYAENTIAEPFDVNEKAIEGKGPAIVDILPTRIIINVWLWPSVRFVYAPGYRVWISPVRWALYPKWWKPWRPIRHSVFIGRCHVHRAFIHRTSHRRVVIHKSYRGRRHSSTLVVKGRKGTTIVHKGRGGKVKAVHRRR